MAAQSVEKVSHEGRLFQVDVVKWKQRGKEVRTMLERGKNERGVIEMVDTESLVPEGHMLRQVDGAVDFERLYEIVEPLYSVTRGLMVGSVKG